MGRKNIYDKDCLYTLLRAIWTDWNIRYSYRKAEIRGLENIPEDGAVILSPNHCNTLMDALVMLRSYKGATVFGARADIFKKPLIAKIMYFLRILPMVRQRDGLRNVLQNNRTQEIIVDTLENNVRFCLFPEGTHRTRHSLQRLGKGVFRIALAANARFAGKKPVYIVPVGLEYGDYFRYRSTSLVNYGEAINVTEFISKGNFESEPQAMEALRQELIGRMSRLISYIPDDDDHEAKWALTRMVAIYKSRKGYGQCGTCLYDSMLKNRAVSSEIEKVAASEPEKMAETLEKVTAFETERKKSCISIYSFRKMNPLWNAIRKSMAALLGFPYFLFSAVAASPMWLLESKIRKGVKDPAFRNTVNFGIKLSLGTILLLIYSVLACCLAPWWMAIALVLLYLPAYSYFHDYIEECRRWFSDIRLYGNQKLYRKYKDIVKDYLRISNGDDK